MKRSLLLFGMCAAVACAQTPSVGSGGVVNAASFAGGQVVTPGSLVSIFGTELAGAGAAADSIPLPSQLANVAVSFNNITAPLLFVSAGQINAQLPWDVLPQGTLQGTATVVVTRNGVSSQPQNFQVGPFSPGIFAVNFGVGYAIAIHADDDSRVGTLAAPPLSIKDLTTFPARAGDHLILLATGLGAVDVPVQSGHNTVDGLRTNTTKPNAFIGGIPATVEFSGMAPEFVGVNQVNIVVPANAPKGNAVPLQLQVGGITSTDQVIIAVE